MLLEHELWRVYKTTDVACLSVYVLAWFCPLRGNKNPALPADCWMWLCLFRGLAMFQIRVEVWEGSCVKELWGVHQIDAEHSVPHSSFRQWLSRAWKAATDMVVIAHMDSCSHERKNISGKINETLQILLSFYEYIVLNLQVWRNSPECRKVREVTY